jgi:hypothetical protein
VVVTIASLGADNLIANIKVSGISAIVRL